MKFIANKTWRSALTVMFALTAAENICSQIIAPAPYSTNATFNYVRTWDATKPISDPDILIASGLKDVKQTTQYFDGLGRPIQTVVKQGSLTTGSSPVDLVSPIAYDSIGREHYKYLSFASNNTGGNFSINDGG